MSFIEFDRTVQVLKREAPAASNLAEWRRLAPIPEHVWAAPLKLWNGQDDQGRPHHAGLGTGPIPTPSSQNHPVHSAAAVGYWRWLADLASYQLARGLAGREHGSLDFYFLGPVTAMMAGLELARRATDPSASAAISTWLRAVWTLDALCAVPVAAAPEEWWLRYPMPEPRLRPIDARLKEWRGLAVAMAGMRIATDGGTETRGPTTRDLLLSWALDASRSYPHWRQIPFGPSTGPAQVIAEVCGNNDYHRTTAAEHWGLTSVVVHFAPIWRAAMSEPRQPARRRRSAPFEPHPRTPSPPGSRPDTSCRLSPIGRQCGAGRVPAGEVWTLTRGGALLLASALPLPLSRRLSP